MNDEFFEIEVEEERSTWIKGTLLAKCKSKNDKIVREKSEVYIPEKILDARLTLDSCYRLKDNQDVYKIEYNDSKTICGLQLPTMLSTLVTENNDSYSLNINGLRFVKQPKVSNVLKEDDYSFATYEGEVIGFLTDKIKVKKQIPVITLGPEKEELEPIPGKEDEPGEEVPIPPIIYPPKIHRVKRNGGCLSGIGIIFGYGFWIFLIGLLIATLGSKFFYIIFGIIAVALLSRIGGFILGLATIVLRFFAGLLLVLFIVFALTGLFNMGKSWNYQENESSEIKKEEVFETTETVETENVPIRKVDTFIVQHRIWKDYSGNKYEIDLKLKKSDLRHATYKRSFIPSVMNMNEFNSVYSEILYADDFNSFKEIYNSLDTLRLNRGLDKSLFAEVIVSMIQDIPYVLILPEACNYSMYSDKFIRDYLSQGNPCLPDIKNGILSPEEFITSLKGDCDTRTLLIFKILNHYDYDVRIFNSEHYGHSIIGIHLPKRKGKHFIINGTPYLTWETTERNIKPGAYLPNQEQKYWTTALY